MSSSQKATGRPDMSQVPPRKPSPQPEPVSTRWNDWLIVAVVIFSAVAISIIWWAQRHAKCDPTCKNNGFETVQNCCEGATDGAK